MSDLIDRQMVIDGLSELVSRFKFVQGDLGGAVSGVREYIKTLPSVEPERTAKVENIQVEWGDDEYVNDRMGDMYHYGNCGNCGETVSHNQKYCRECGARLEWDE